MKKQFGFTLIELVIVITLLGILAATALPKFANLTGSAYTAANQGIGGSLSSAINIVHSSYLASGQTAAGTVALECTTATPNTTGNVYASASGWPVNAAANAGPPACTAAAAPGTVGAPTAAECKAVWDNIMNNPPTSSTAACAAIAGVCYGVTVANTTDCVYTYFNGGTVLTPSRTITYRTTTGAVTISNP